MQRFVQTCLVAPSQWEGRVEDGRMFYVRVRHGRLQVRISAGPTTDISDAVAGPTVLDRRLDDPHESFMDTTTMVRSVSNVLDFGEVRIP